VHLRCLQELRIIWLLLVLQALPVPLPRCWHGALLLILLSSVLLLLKLLQLWLLLHRHLLLLQLRQLGRSAVG